MLHVKSLARVTSLIPTAWNREGYPACFHHPDRDSNSRREAKPVQMFFTWRSTVWGKETSRSAI